MVKVGDLVKFNGTLFPGVPRYETMGPVRVVDVNDQGAVRVEGVWLYFKPQAWLLCEDGPW